MSDSGLADLGPSNSGHIPEPTPKTLAEFNQRFAAKMQQVIDACERIENELDKLIEALEPRP